jgi:hypothetical protein
MFDILGFRALLDDQGLEGLTAQVNELHRVLSRTFKWEARFVTFSDTILLYSKPLLSRTSELHEFVVQREADAFFRYCTLLQARSLEIGLPLRGGVAAGECVVVPSRGLFIGSPIIDAYVASESQDWIGVLLHPSCDALLLGWDGEYAVTTRATIPLKGGRTVEGWTLDWPRMTFEPVALRGSLLSSVRAHQDSPHAERWKRTWDFFEGRFSLLGPVLPDAAQHLPVQRREI